MHTPILWHNVEYQGEEAKGAGLIWELHQTVHALPEGTKFTASNPARPTTQLPERGHLLEPTEVEPKS